MEHVLDLRSGQLRNAMVKHRQVHHPNESPVFESEALVSAIRFNLEHFIMESLLIEKAKNERGTLLLNQRGEWGHFGITSLRVTDDR